MLFDECKQIENFSNEKENNHWGKKTTKESIRKRNKRKRNKTKNSNVKISIKFFIIILLI